MKLSRLMPICSPGISWLSMTATKRTGSRTHSDGVARQHVADDAGRLDVREVAGRRRLGALEAVRAQVVSGTEEDGEDGSSRADRARRTA